MKYRLLDRIVEVEKWKFGRGIKMPSLEECMLTRDGVFPRFFLLESLVQLLGKVVQYSSDFQYTATIKDVFQGKWLESVASRLANVDMGNSFFLEVRIEKYDLLDDMMVVFHGDITVKKMKVFTLDTAVGQLIRLSALNGLEESKLEFYSIYST
ncbi:MAG: hypothetical protein HQK53_10015 [Oligoflexia bacterium]|nr:hypothetical protein [Oligoflexia bacterium]